MIELSCNTGLLFVNRYLTTVEVGNGSAILLPSIQNIIYIPVSFAVNNFNFASSLTQLELINGTSSATFTGIHSVANNFAKLIEIKDSNIDVGSVQLNFNAVVPVANDVFVSLGYYIIPKQ